MSYISHAVVQSGGSVPFLGNGVGGRMVTEHLFIYIQGVPGGMDKTSGECSLG